MVYRDEQAGIYLRPIESSDTDLIICWRNSEGVRKHFIYQEPFTRQGHEKWLAEMVDTGKAVQMMIVDIATEQPLGSVYIRDIDRKHQKAEYGIFIGEENARGRGIGTATARLMLQHCFTVEKLHRVFLRAFATNERAIKSYEKAGFVREACLHDDVYVNGRYCDIVLMAKLADQ